MGRKGGKGRERPTGFPGSRWHKGKIKFTQGTLLQVIQTLSCKQSKVTTTERKSKNKNLPKTTCKMAWVRTPQQCWVLSIRATHALSPSETEPLCKGFFSYFFSPPEVQAIPATFSQIIFLVLCLPSMHITPNAAVSVTRSDHIAFSNEKHNGEGEEEKKRKEGGKK